MQRYERRERWELFARRRADDQAIERNLYKNVAGDKLIFEEVNHVLGLRYRYAWRTSDRLAWCARSGCKTWATRRATCVCSTACATCCPLRRDDALQTTMSNLLNAYKRSELDAASGFGIFALSATLTDRVEPSESLKATMAWQVGWRTPHPPALRSNWRRSAAAPPSNRSVTSRGSVAPTCSAPSWPAAPSKA